MAVIKARAQGSVRESSVEVPVSGNSRKALRDRIGSCLEEVKEAFQARARSCAKALERECMQNTRSVTQRPQVNRDVGLQERRKQGQAVQGLPGLIRSVPQARVRTVNKWSSQIQDQHNQRAVFERAVWKEKDPHSLNRC